MNAVEKIDLNMKAQEKPLKVQVGCGLTAPEDWVNIDCSWNAWLAKWPLLRKCLSAMRILPEELGRIPWSRSIVIRDVRQPMPFRSDSVDALYASHIVEHFTQEEAKRFAVECFRVLKKGGILRVIVPDLLALVQTYLDRSLRSQGDAPAAPADRFLNELGLFETSPPRAGFLVRVVRRFQDKNTHKWMYDARSLATLLRQAGFRTVQSKMCGESRISDIDKLDDPKRFQGSICLEAEK